MFEFGGGDEVGQGLTVTQTVLKSPTAEGHISEHFCMTANKS